MAPTIDLSLLLMDEFIFRGENEESRYQSLSQPICLVIKILSFIDDIM